MKQYLLFLLLISAVCSNAQTVYKTMKRLPDTGQNSSYTSTFGEDADYTTNPPAYNKNGDGTLTDTVTGLLWQQTDGGEMTIEQATAYCDTLTLAGHTDWRLPTCHELFSILNHDKVNPALDTAYFTLSTADYWWSGQRQANDSSKVWATNAGGGVGNHPKTETISAGGNKRFHVRAVRDVTSPPLLAAHFSANNQLVSDSLTDLLWTAIPSADSLTWEEALHYADTLSFAGFTDWRLPNIKELQSVNDESRISPSINQTYFTGIKTGKYWSGTTLPNHTTWAWYLDTRFGITTYADKTSRLLVWCVRTAETVSGMDEEGFNQNTLTIYPNPASTGFYIKEVQTTSAQVKIINMQGAELSCPITLGTNYLQVITQQLPNGLYIIKLSDNQQIKTARVTVVH